MEPDAVRDAVIVWLRRVCSQEEPPTSVIAFNIGLFESEKGFSAYLTGAERYDPSNAEWACEEAFTPHERYLELPFRPAAPRWDAVLQLVADGARSFVAAHEGANSFLAKAQALTVGFDDGDLVRIR